MNAPGNVSEGISSCLRETVESSPKPTITIDISATRLRLARLSLANLDMTWTLRAYCGSGRGRQYFV